jgi:hypothetical protein
LSVQQYLEQSGMIDQYLADRGIDLESLKSSVDQHVGQNFEGQWGAAVDQFLHSEIGGSWPGGKKNLAIAQALIVQQGNYENPSVEALEKAWQTMQAQGTFFPLNDDDEAVLRAVQAQSPEDVSKAHRAGLLEKAQPVSPREILEAWKEAHKDLTPEEQNDLFVRSHSSTGSGLFGVS